MCKIKLNIHILNIYLLFSVILLMITKIKAIEISIRNDDKIHNINNIIFKNQIDKKLTLNFIDQYYDMTKFPYLIDIISLTDISLIGNSNGTVFDFKNDRIGLIKITHDGNGETIVIKNIIFKNFFNKEFIRTKSELSLINLTSPSDNFFFVLSNCTIQNSYHCIMYFDVTTSISTHDNPSIVIENCNF